PAQILEDTCTDFVLDFTGLCIAVENRSESLHELLVTVGLVEGDEAVAFDMFARRWASSVLAHKLVFPRLLGNRGHGLLVLSLNQLRQLVSLPSAGRAVIDTVDGRPHRIRIGRFVFVEIITVLYWFLPQLIRPQSRPFHQPVNE